MRRRDLDFLVSLLLAASMALATASGLLADWFGLHHVTLHTLAGYASAILAASHVALNWGRISAYLRGRLHRRVSRPLRDEVRGAHASVGAGASRPLARRQVLTALLAAAGGFLLGRLVPRSRPAEVPTGPADLGAFYHEWSKPRAAQLLGPAPDWGSRPPGEKRYPDAPTFALPAPHGDWGPSVGEALVARRSVRDYRSEPLALQTFSRLLYAAQGITDPQRGFRTAPSAGALYPLELYAVVHRVEGLEPGLYHYNAPGHTLERIQAGDLRAAIVRSGLGQGFLGTAAVCLVLSAVFQRTRWRYRERTYRYVLLEAGHAAQNIYLAATALGLGACAVGAFLDDALSGLLGLDGTDEAALYVLSVGPR